MHVHARAIHTHTYKTNLSHSLSGSLHTHTPITYLLAITAIESCLLCHWTWSRWTVRCHCWWWQTYRRHLQQSTRGGGNTRTEDEFKIHSLYLWTPTLTGCCSQLQQESVLLLSAAQCCPLWGMPLSHSWPKFCLKKRGGKREKRGRGNTYKWATHLSLA